MLKSKIVGFFKRSVNAPLDKERAFYDPSGSHLATIGILFFSAALLKSFQIEFVGLLVGRSLSVWGAALLIGTYIKPMVVKSGSYQGLCLVLLGVTLENISRLLDIPLSVTSGVSATLLVVAVLLYLVAPRYLERLGIVTGAAMFMYGLTMSTAVFTTFSLTNLLFPFILFLLPSLVLAIHIYVVATKVTPGIKVNGTLYALILASIPAYIYTSATGYLTETTDIVSVLYRTIPIISILLIVPSTITYLVNRGDNESLRVLKPLATFVVILAVFTSSISSIQITDTVAVDTPYEYNKRAAANLLTTGSINSMTSEEGAGPKKHYRGLSFDECDTQNARDCFITYYDTMAMRYGVTHAVKDIIDKVKTNRGVNFPSHCHQTVHNLGQMAYTVAETFDKAAAIDPQVCGTGYTHGLWEQKFVEIGSTKMFGDTGSLCTELNMVSPWYKWTCHHILGHIMSQTLSQDPGTAAAYCTKVTDPQALTDCLTGAWMNFFQDDVVIERMRKDGNMLNLFGVCYGAPQTTKFFCYQELFPVIYAMVGGNDYEASQACILYAEPSRGIGDPWVLTSENYTDRCIQGLARGVSASSAIDYRVIARRCLDMTDKAQDPCLTAGAASVVLNTGSTKAAFDICPLVQDQGYREYCYFWAKHARTLLANGPNDFNLPSEDEIRTPEAPKNN